MVQLEFFRRAGKGRLSEIGFLGLGFLPMDIATRREGLTDTERRKEIAHLPVRIRIEFKAFADGVNKYLAEIAADSTKVSAEFILLGINPSPGT